jgi:hypothetical protein
MYSGETIGFPFFLNDFNNSSKNEGFGSIQNAKLSLSLIINWYGKYG